MELGYRDQEEAFTPRRVPLVSGGGLLVCVTSQKSLHLLSLSFLICKNGGMFVATVLKSPHALPESGHLSNPGAPLPRNAPGGTVHILFFVDGAFQGCELLLQSNCSVNESHGK